MQSSTDALLDSQGAKKERDQKGSNKRQRDENTQDKSAEDSQKKLKLPEEQSSVSPSYFKQSYASMQHAIKTVGLYFSGMIDGAKKIFLEEPTPLEPIFSAPVLQSSAISAIPEDDRLLFCEEKRSAKDIRFNTFDRFICRGEAIKEKLEEDNPGFTYVNVRGGNGRDKIYLARDPFIHELGVFANEDFSVSHDGIARYVGKREVANFEDSDNAYLFELKNKKGNTIGFINAKKQGDYTRYFNFSRLSNLRAEQKSKKGKKKQEKIVFYVADEVAENDQLLLNYGEKFFEKDDGGLYLYAKDGMLPDQEKYRKNQVAYHSSVFTLKKSPTVSCLPRLSTWVLPTTFLDIQENRIEALRKKLRTIDPNLLGYVLDQKNDELFFEENPKLQPHFTALMLACFLGREECIELLLAKNADVNRCTLYRGHNALMYLLRGQATQALIDRFGKLLLEKTTHYFITDRDGLGLLHYAIQKNQAGLVQQLLDMAKTDKLDLLDDMFFRHEKLPAHADLDFCIQAGYWEILEILLSHMQDKLDWSDYIKKEYIFRNETFQKNEMATKQVRRLLKKQFPKIWRDPTVQERFAVTATDNIGFFSAQKHSILEIEKSGIVAIIKNDRP